LIKVGRGAFEQKQTKESKGIGFPENSLRFLRSLRVKNPVCPWLLASPGDFAVSEFLAVNQA
jgi:hypothetical protein